MDFKAFSEFNKYTIALAAGCFVYALEKFTPMSTTCGRWLLVGVLALLLISLVIGIVMFAAATSAQYGDDARKKRIEAVIPGLGIAHWVFLGIGVLILGGMVVDRVLTPPAAINVLYVVPSLNAFSSIDTASGWPGNSAFAHASISPYPHILLMASHV